jgi:hypothetical protein
VTTMGRIARAAVCLTLSTAAATSAQDRGRTDGPEGSEIGKGGYSRPGGADFSLALTWGVAITPDVEGTPSFVGGEAGFWADEQFGVEIAGLHVFDTSRWEILIGPRLRTRFFPISLSVAVKAGAIIVDERNVRFGISPQGGVEMLFADHIVFGLHYAVDFPLGGGDGDQDVDETQRVFLALGLRL